MSFYKPCPPVDLGDINFMPLGHSSNKIIAMDREGNTLLCEGSSRAIGVMPSPHEPKLVPISLIAGDNLYLLDSVAEEGHSFEVLIYPPVNDNCFEEDKWYWRSLPSPPFGFVYRDGEMDGESYRNHYVFQAYTVVGDSQIWISTAGGPTYSFNTSNSMWSKAGNWELPFDGPVKYAPELGLWFGFSSQGGQFAASDLNTTSTMTQQVLQKAWDELVQPLPDRWFPVESYLQPLGTGKFCIVRTFEMAEEGWCREKDGSRYDNVENFAVFTGVEVLRGRRGALRMIKHKSRRYSFGQWSFIQPL